MLISSSAAKRIPNLNSALNSTILQLADNGSAPTRFLLLREGDIGWAGLNGISMDAVTADRIIANFEKHGSMIPIDWHHATEKVDASKGGKAPAAGFIRSLEYEPDHGLYAANVEWTSEGREDVEKRRFAYSSPGIVPDENNQIVRISSVGLTNKPRTIGAKELLIAAELADQEMKPMTKYKKLLAEVRKMAKSLRLELGAEDVGDGADSTVDAVPEFPAVDKSAKAISDLIEVLRGRGVEIADDASMADVMLAAISELQGKEDTADASASEGDKASEGDTATDTTETAEMPAAERARETHARQLKKRVAELQARLDRRDADDRKANASLLVAEYVMKDIINPNDDEAMEAATELAESDAATFKKIYGTLQPYTKAKMAESPGHSADRSARTRKAAIVRGKAEWVEAELGSVCTLAEHINQTLRENGHTLLADDEIKAIV